MKTSTRNDQICAPKILRENQVQRQQMTSVLTMVIMLATVAVGLTGLSGLSA